MKTYVIDVVDTDYRALVGSYRFEFEADEQAEAFCSKRSGGGEDWDIDWEATRKANKV